MRSLPGSTVTLVIIMALPGFGLPVAETAQSFADPSFRSTWERTDKPVTDGSVKRSFYWGPAPLQTHSEPYAEGASGKRTVQYFDKSRMEINNPSANRNDPFYVTNGLLTVELMTGRVQVGNNSFVERYPAQIPLASDTDDTGAPTYASFARLMGKADNKTGQRIVNRLERDGTVKAETLTGAGPETVAYYEPATGHNLPTVFKAFLDQQGPVWVSGRLQTARLSDPWFYTTGFPITEAYWAKVKIAGKRDTDVYIQAFQRRVLTYVPSFPQEFQVQMGNIGLHYYDWRYRDAGKPASTPTLDPRPPTPGTQIQVAGAVKTAMTFDVAALKAMTATNVTATFTEADGSRRTARYTGPLLLDVLKRAGGEGDAGRDLLERYIVVTGEGGRKVAVSWGEIDPIFMGTQAILAYARDGVDLGGVDGPARLVMPKDKSGLRSLYGLNRIEVKTVPYAQPSGTTLVIGGEVTRTLQLTANDLPSRNPQTVTVTYMAGGVTSTHIYKGVPLLQLVNEAGVKSTGTDRQRDLLTRIVVGMGRDDSRLAIFSWGEVDPQYAGVNVLVAYEEDGVRLGGNLTRLVAPQDARGGRYTPYLLTLTVMDATR
jgi:DMSO/TMAO reductase YedYZ molybdopterin-dependent catalytic subunit